MKFFKEKDLKKLEGMEFYIKDLIDGIGLIAFHDINTAEYSEIHLNPSTFPDLVNHKVYKVKNGEFAYQRDITNGELDYFKRYYDYLRYYREDDIQEATLDIPANVKEIENFEGRVLVLDSSDRSLICFDVDNQKVFWLDRHIFFTKLEKDHYYYILIENYDLADDDVFMPAGYAFEIDAVKIDNIDRIYLTEKLQ